MERAPLQPADAEGGATQEADDGRVQEPLEPGVDRAPVRDGLHEVPRFGVEVDREVLGRAIQLGEDPPERLGERGGRVLHPRRLADATAAPGVPNPEAPVGPEPYRHHHARGDERQPARQHGGRDHAL